MQCYITLQKQVFQHLRMKFFNYFFDLKHISSVNFRLKITSLVDKSTISVTSIDYVILVKKILCKNI